MNKKINSNSAIEKKDKNHFSSLKKYSGKSLRLELEKLELRLLKLLDFNSSKYNNLDDKQIKAIREALRVFSKSLEEGKPYSLNILGFKIILKVLPLKWKYSKVLSNIETKEPTYLEVGIFPKENSLISFLHELSHILTWNFVKDLYLETSLSKAVIRKVLTEIEAWKKVLEITEKLRFDLNRKMLEYLLIYSLEAYFKEYSPMEDNLSKIFREEKEKGFFSLKKEINGD